MLETFVLVAWLALNMAPSDATSLTLEMPNHNLHFTRQADGWKAEQEGQPLGIFRVAGSRIQIQGDGGAGMDEEVAGNLGLTGKVDWTSLKTVQLGGEAKIERVSDGFDLVVPASGSDQPEERYKIRWATKR